MSDASENLSAAIATRDGPRCQLLGDIRKAAPLAPDVRRMYSARNIADAFTALALLIDTSPLGRTMGNVYPSVARLPMPMKMFVESCWRSSGSTATGTDVNAGGPEGPPLRVRLYEVGL